METFLICAGVVALGEIGDKTQLLALMLAARYRKPGPIVLGIVIATLANHALAGLIGNAVQRALPPDVLRWFVAIAFFAVALWALKPDTMDEQPREQSSSMGVLAVTVVTFFLAEMGDKTQIATALLAARFS
ncbi:MAG TPA: TMEM165/GDT1 family protein, partial [Casimicrobiaceae bacterium]|nr:TMEM165/GDT1 family protein [Casimicrobiaceae bacterium]